MIIGKKITRRKSDSVHSTNYFTSETQNAIVAFANETDVDKKKKIYTESIKEAFETLVENLINVYGFHVSFETKQDLKNHCVSELYEIIEKFKPEKGSKAFSYFNVVAKRWLIMHAMKSVKMTQNFLSIDNKDSFLNHELEIIENYNVIPSADEIITNEQYRNEIKQLLKTITEKVKTENEKITIKAIEVIFNNLDDLDFSNKRAIMNYLREITRLSPKKLSVALSALKKYYKIAKFEEEI
jgi:hypothetical protein